MGTPEFAATILRRLLRTEHIELVAVYTQPDRPSGRGHKLCFSPVKALAGEHALPVLQPEHFKRDPQGDAAVAELAAFAPDLLLVAAYGLILPQRVLDIPARMPLNVHASLLPRYRGAAPIQRAIMAGETVTGVTIMRMQAALDSGPILMQRAVGIGIGDTARTLHDELAREGAELLVSALERLRAGALGEIRQDDSLASHAPKLRKEEAYLDLSLPAASLHALVRGLSPWPGAALFLHRPGAETLLVKLEPGSARLTEKQLALAAGFAAAHAYSDNAGLEAGSACAVRPGLVLGCADDALVVACGQGEAYAFYGLKPAGGKLMGGQAFYNGYLRDTHAFWSSSED
ncbi:methionyl-tRNA formyltransferase [Desulfovibrio sp. OttesenSCG-928-A18]|nr:methionyl-tRNA formyltransferase [Desulfovibrio sp. OttesenSCG-928-A18]